MIPPLSLAARAITPAAWIASLLGVPLAHAPLPRPLYLPRQIRMAYEKGTRSADGRPGPNYWENHARYTISVNAAFPNRTLTGTEQIVYTNNSPDTLHAIVFKLLLNIHKPGVIRNAPASADYLTSGVHVDAFSLNGKAAKWNDEGVGTWQPVRLLTPLAPHDSLRIGFNWHVELSRESNREGMLDSTTAFLAYFYPRVAVYDDYNGWDTMDFTDQQEFYSDFNDYDVTVNVPKNFVVWGTGTLTNPASVLQPAIADRLQRSMTSDQVLHVATRDEMAAHQVTTQDSVNAWHFTASNIPDMTFAVSDHYDWDAASVIVDDAAKRRASVQAAFNDTAADYHHMVEYGRHSLDWLSHHWPGVPYPYEKTTIVQGIADMEYPMMVNDNTTADTTFSRFVVEHEIAHTWFPFYMGINESRYAFMDEGWATTFEYLIGTADLGAERAATFYKQFRVAGWAHDPSPLEDLPIITPEDMLKGAAYGNNAYGKASLGYLALKELLGDDVFAKCLHAYIDRWHGKHPIPWDFFNTFNNVSGRDLNWFWNNWYFSNAYIDLAVAAPTKNAAGYTVAVRNIGGMAAPFTLNIEYSDGSHDALHRTPSVWQANQEQTSVAVPTRKTIKSMSIDGGIWMDADTTNNRWPLAPHGAR